MIWVSQQGGEKKYRFPDLANLSNRYLPRDRVCRGTPENDLRHDQAQRAPGSRAEKIPGPHLSVLPSPRSSFFRGLRCQRILDTVCIDRDTSLWCKKQSKNVISAPLNGSVWCDTRSRWTTILRKRLTNPVKSGKFPVLTGSVKRVRHGCTRLRVQVRLV